MSSHPRTRARSRLRGCGRATDIVLHARHILWQAGAHDTAYDPLRQPRLAPLSPHTAANVTASTATSLDRLGMDSVDLMYLHRWDDELFSLAGGQGLQCGGKI